MGRRCFGLLVALALLVAPGVAIAAAQHGAADGHVAARVTLVDHHTSVVHVVVRPSSGRERRSPHDPASTLAVLAGGTGIVPGVARAALASSLKSTPGDVRSSSRPRAPPAAV
jgi:hypothetical protein